MQDNDMVYTRNDTSIQVAGYRFDNSFLHDDVGPYTVFKKDDNKDFMINDTYLNDLAVPTGLLYIQSAIHNNTYDPNINYIDNDTYIDESLYDKLLDLVGPSKEKEVTSDKKFKTNKSKKLKMKGKRKTKKIRV